MHKQKGPPSSPSNKNFYGWWIVFAGFILLFASSGIGFYSHGVILDPLCRLHGWSKGTISGAITLYFFANGIVGLIIGRWIDRYGPRWFLVSGSIVFGAALFSLNFIHTVPLLFITYLIMSVGFCATSLIPVNTLIANWFIKKRGLAMSISSTGLSAGGVILVPFTSFLILKLGLNPTLSILGAAYVLIIVPLTLIFIKYRPSDIHQFPDGINPQASSNTESENTNKIQMTVWTRRKAMKTGVFWSIAIAFMLALAGQIAFLVHQVSFLSRFIGPQKAAAAVSITAGASIMGRLLLGLFVDRLNSRYVIMTCILCQGIAVITLAFYSHVAILYLCTFVFGLTMGSLLMMQPLIIGECFGIPSFATVSGTIGLFSLPGSAFGPVIAGLIFDWTQSYQYSFIFFGVVSFIAMGVIYFAKPPVYKK